ncbi:MAG: hypothetical protein JXB23_13190 [Candidatus Aminicenantes bacterium]|nr:hypothetical protein [Candidatus Aminicenantes bacterium]
MNNAFVPLKRREFLKKGMSFKFMGLVFLQGFRLPSSKSYSQGGSLDSRREDLRLWYVVRKYGSEFGCVKPKKRSVHYGGF